MSIGIKITCFSMRIELRNRSHLSDTYAFIKVIIPSHLPRIPHIIRSFWSWHPIINSHTWTTDSSFPLCRILYRDIVIELTILSDPILVEGIDMFSCHLEYSEWVRQSSWPSRIELIDRPFAMEHRHIIGNHYKLEFLFVSWLIYIVDMFNRWGSLIQYWIYFNDRIRLTILPMIKLRKETHIYIDGTSIFDIDKSSTPPVITPLIIEIV